MLTFVKFGNLSILFNDKILLNKKIKLEITFKKYFIPVSLLKIFAFSE